MWLDVNTLETWKYTSDELKVSTLIHYMKDYNDIVDGTYDHYILLTLAANGFLRIEYDRQLVDDSVLRHMDKRNITFIGDEINVREEKFEHSISIVHTVPVNHPLCPLVEYAQSHYVNNYTHSHDTYASKFEADFKLSYLLLLIGEKKLRENFRKIFLDTYQPKSDAALWDIPNEDLFDLDQELSESHDVVHPVPENETKWYGGWESFAMDLLEIKQGRVLDFCAGIGTLAMQLNLEDVEYIANTKQSEEFDLMDMFFYTDSIFSDYYARKRIQMYSEESFWKEGKLADYVVANLYNDKSVRENEAYNIGNRHFPFNEMAIRLSSKGKALVACNNRTLRDTSFCVPLVDSIILVGCDKSVILLNKDKERADIIRVYDRTDWDNFTAEQLLGSIRRQEDLHILTQEDIKEMGGYFNIDVFKRKQYKVDVPNGHKLVRLSDVVERATLHEKAIENTKLLDDNEDYNPLSPYISADKCIDDFDYSTPKNALLIDRKLLVIHDQNLWEKRFFHPIIFDPSEGEAKASPSCNCFIVNEEKISIDYLVYEMNKEYFLNQLFPHKGNAVNRIKAEDVLSCQILVPDVESSVERQKQYIEDLRQKEIAKIAQRYGFDLGKFVQYKASDLLKGTTLRNGKYTILGNIGHGGFGKVYKAQNEETGEIVAIKEFYYHSRQVRDPETNNVRTNFADIGYVDDAKDKFRRERDKIKECAHDHIVQVYEEFDENNTSYYVMEYIDGNTLKEYPNIGEREALAIIRQVAEALKSMHEKQYNHSDVKPQNILLDSNGMATLIDFSGAHRYGNDEEEGLSKTGNSIPMEIKTPGYTPDWAYKAKGFHAGRDIYSLGATLYYMLTGNEPATIDKQVKPAKISPKSWHAICLAMEEDPRKWIKSMDAFLNLLPGDEELDVCEEQKNTEPLRITPYIKNLGEDEVFVFGSNVVGHHTGGAAKQALKLGAKWGVASGPMGQTYAIPTVGVHGLDVIERYVSQFIKYFEENDHLTFYVTAIGCGSAGFTPEQIAPFFKDLVEESNVYLPESFWRVLMNKGFIKAEDYNATIKGNHDNDKNCSSQSGGKKRDEVAKKAQESKKDRRGFFGAIMAEMEKIANDVLEDESN